MSSLPTDINHPTPAAETCVRRPAGVDHDDLSRPTHARNAVVSGVHAHEPIVAAGETIAATRVRMSRCRDDSDKCSRNQLRLHWGPSLLLELS